MICVFILFAGMLRRKTLVLDLDETLIHSHHDGVIRETVKPGTPPDFVLKVITVMTLSFRTDGSGQTVQTQIRLLRGAV